MKKNIKLYLHHSHFEPVSYSKRTGLFGFIIDFLTSFFYLVGFAVLTILKLPVTIFKFLINFKEHFQKVAHNIREKKFQKTLAIFTLLVLIAASMVHGLIVVATGQKIKGQVLGESTVGITHLQNAKDSLMSNNPEGAQENFQKALESFKASEKTLNSSSVGLKSLLSVIPQKKDADRILFAAENLTQAAIYATELIQLTEEMKISAVGLSNGLSNRADLEQAQNLLSQIVQLAEQSATNINAISITSLPKNYQPAFVSVKDSANLFLSSTESLKEVFSLVFDILLGEKNILIVFQNNNELRASGGFMGTIGNAKLSNGSLGFLDVRSVYDWDGQLKEKIFPPQPIYAVNDRLFLRDSNWFGSFPVSASIISTMFEKEGGETPDLIITMTPEVILQMLEVTGPIEMPQYGLTLGADNFVETVQTATSVNYDREVNQPKQLLADFFPLLMDRFGTSEKGGLMGFMDLFNKSLSTKNILIYSRNKSIQDKILSLNWGGEIRNTEKDYLYVVNSNLGGTKTDRFLSRETKLESIINPDGSVINTINYSVTNPLPNNDALKNKSFIRFYVPENSTLKSSNGFNTDVQLPRLTSPDFILDRSVQQWQEGVTQDTVSGTFTGKESGKTWFGNWLEVKGGETKTVTISYELPYKLSGVSTQSLLIQKQPGSLNETFIYSLQYPNRTAVWSSPEFKNTENRLNFNSEISKDVFIGAVIQ
jgi:hypothetical protein